MSESYPEKFLAIVLEALNHAKEFEDASTWKESKWDTPSLCKVNDRYEVDKEQFAAFETILHFLTLAIFGVDSEGRARGRLVEWYLKDGTSDRAALPVFPVNHPDGIKNNLRKLLRAKELAEINVKAALQVVEEFDFHIKRLLRDQFDKEDFVNRAKGCTDCGGKGYVKYSAEDYRKLEKESWTDKEDRKGFFLRTSFREKYGVPYRAVVCGTCQPDEVLK